MTNKTREVWSTNNEEFKYESLEELLYDYPDMQIGDPVWKGEAANPAPSRFVNVSSIIDEICDCAWDIGGEHAGDFIETLNKVSYEAKAELKSLIADWIARQTLVNFSIVEETEIIILTSDHFAEAGIMVKA